MVTFFDGPAKFIRLNLKRTPTYLRVVVNGKFIDALDMPEDVPSNVEVLYAYKIVERTRTSGFLCGKGCTTFVSAEYKLCNIQPNDSVLRNNVEWVKWVEEIEVKKQKEKLLNENEVEF